MHILCNVPWIEWYTVPLFWPSEREKHVLMAQMMPDTSFGPVLVVATHPNSPHPPHAFET